MREARRMRFRNGWDTRNRRGSPLLASITLASAAAGACMAPAGTSLSAGPTRPAATASAAYAPMAAQEGDPAAEATGGTLSVAFRQDALGGFDPHVLASPSSELWLTGTIFETLTRLEPGFEVGPELAESWESTDDMTTWTFHLREGVVFTDGSPFDADAVKANFDRLFELSPIAPTTYGPYFDSGDIEVSDPHTVIFHLSQPYSLLPSLLGQFPALMISGKAIAEGVDQNADPVGTGPFDLDSYEPGVAIDLARNDDYWGVAPDGSALPYLDAIELRVILDGNQRLNAIRTGEVDVAMFLDPTQRDVLPDDVVQVIDPEARLAAISLNDRQSVWQDERVREAFSLALDRQALLTVGTGGPGQVAFGLFPESSPYYDPAVETSEGAPSSHRDVDRARALLAEAGYPDGIDLTDSPFVAYVETPDLQRVSEAALEQLREAGFDFGNVTVCTYTECSAIFESGNWSAAIQSIPLSGDPLLALESIYTPTARSTVSRWDLGPAVNDAILAVVRAPEDKRVELARAAQSAILEAQPGSAVQLFFLPQLDATSGRVVNYGVRPYYLQRNWAVVGFAQES